MSNDALPALHLTTEQAIHWFELSVAALKRARPALDQANVFPIADADTGTNMFLTLTHAAAPQPITARATNTQTVDALLNDVAHRAVLSARGNSGAILAHYLSGFARGHHAGGVATALKYGASQARDAVAHPVEGTILTAADAAAHALDAHKDRPIADVLHSVRQSVYHAYENSEHDLPALAARSVRDAGACGFYLVISALIDVLAPTNATDNGETPRAETFPEDTLRTGAHHTETPQNTTEHGVDHGQHTNDISDTEYEVTALMHWKAQPTTHEISALRRAMADRGDSLVLAISPTSPSVGPLHIHTNNPADIITLCHRTADTVSHIAVRNLHNPQLAATAPVVLSRSPHLVRDLARSAATVIMAGTSPLTADELSALLPDTPQQRIIANARSIDENLTQTYPHIHLLTNDLDVATHLTYADYGEQQHSGEHSTHHTFTPTKPPTPEQLTDIIQGLPAHTTALLLHDTHFPTHHQRTIHDSLTHHGITTTVIPSGTPSNTADLTLTWNT
ncbi:DAK2 domain-containing protein [Jonesia quinghaiensis]|uniref:DAK2 domain-containing protein n=1 Tax=Jonesia quinghaiensis TaxID=262806 RepID=UPI00146E377D|nr:DAK2 domain-containing protein [Jonesia quinghaiensis]